MTPKTLPQPLLFRTQASLPLPSPPGLALALWGQRTFLSEGIDSAPLVYSEAVLKHLLCAGYHANVFNIIYLKMSFTAFT